MLQLIECPRDAMQGLDYFIPTEDKINYLNILLKAGFHTLDFGSFVSPKAIPQLKDTAEVLSALETDTSNTKLLAIIANIRGAEEAVKHKSIQYLGYPLSLSETFQQRNTKRGIKQAIEDLKEIKGIADNYGKVLVVYLSMGFGNPYGDPWDVNIVDKKTEILAKMGVQIVSLADTVGTAKTKDISYLFSALIPAYPEVTFGAHFHATPTDWKIKAKAALESGCLRFDSAIKGYGGCPMAEDKLTGNMPTELLLSFLKDEGLNTGIDRKVLIEAMNYADRIFKA